ncbi:MAG: DJ-1 family protein [Candidatus Portnoybacteria bacterium CG10_big_fil_rev_8_21_14_0_10_38_18]|uniref:DJ-1 family protein n=1 Tax=Candidatus Portnoybacteria bacterium CG10_big_fil_rev_8_21_14_0_10_38_18 TaxID=1974813 RepID=A0A2M8KC12_9BACT|nr:MAG: DJ-1 family protein [Candidatus Portnoybacteria bacterium CG10_big_fil_rev_8_21_14_0_10_38_18]
MKILIIIVIIIVLGIGSYFLFFKKEKESIPGEETTNMSNLSNIKIAMIVAYKDFRDEEYFVPRGIFDEAGFAVKVVSDEIGTAQGADGGDVNIDIDLGELDVSDFDAIIFIGGPGALTHLDNEESYKIARDTLAQNKILAAICISPTILAKAGVLNGKKATVWTSPLNKEAENVLEQNGAIYQDEKVVQDGNIITADDPSSAKEFANKIVDALK